MAGPETSLRMALARAIALPLSFISPAAAGRYLAGHARLAAGLIGYDAARRDGPNGRWLPRDGKADPMLARDARIIRARARAMARDNGNISGALRKIVANVVYSGLTPQAQHRDATGARDCAACGALENDWKDWAEENDIWLIQQLALRHLWLDGGFFLHFYAVPRFQKDGLVPLGVELLDMDALDMSVHGPQPNGNIARYGAEYDSRGNLLAWHIFEESLYGGVLDEGWTRDPAVHPAFGAGRTLRLKAEDCRLVMQPDRIGQTLPVSWMHAVIMGMHNFDEYQTSEQIAARLAAAFAIFHGQQPFRRAPESRSSGRRADHSGAGAFHGYLHFVRPDRRTAPGQGNPDRGKQAPGQQLHGLHQDQPARSKFRHGHELRKFRQ